MTKYRQVLYQPDRVLLHSELNETQEIFQNQIKEVSNAVFNNGAIIRGLSVNLSDGKLEVNEGEIYIDGKIEKVKRKTFDIPKNTDNIPIYLKLIEKIIKSSKLDSLKDPVTGQIAADRKIINNELCTNKNEIQENIKYIKLFNFNIKSETKEEKLIIKTNLKLDDFDGNIHASRIKSSTISHHDTPKNGNSLFEVIAERTADQCSSFIVKGLETIIGTTNNDSVEVITGVGRAYVNGYRLESINPKSFIIKKSIDTEFVTGEPHQIKKEVIKYKLHKAPLAEITKITAVKEVKEVVTLSRSLENQGFFELELSNTPIYKINYIELSKNKEKIYSNLWKLSGDKIIITDNITAKKYFGESLNIEYQYNCILKENFDFKLKQNSENIEFIVPIVDNTIFTVDYKYFVGRKDIIYAVPDGIKIKPGSGSKNPVLPSIPVNSLKLCEINCPPNNLYITIKNFNTKAISMEIINNMLRDIEFLKRNAALQKINTAFSDQTMGKARALTYYFSEEQGDIDLSHVEWDANFDSKNNIITLPEKKKFIPLEYDTKNSDHSVFNANNILCIGGKETVLLGKNYKDTADNIEKIKHWSLSDQIKPVFTITPGTIVSKNNIIKVEGFNFGSDKELQVQCSCGKVKILNQDMLKTGKDGKFKAKIKIDLKPKVSTGDHTLTISNKNIKRTAKLTLKKDHRKIKASSTKLFPAHKNTSNRRDCFAQIVKCTDSCTIVAIRIILSSATNPLILQIRGVENNKPNNTVEWSLNSGQILCQKL